MNKIVIVGGGISGLSTAYFLQEVAKSKGIDLKYWLIEKNDRLGGNIITEKINDFIVEGGPDNFLSQKPWALDLVKKLGLGPHILNTSKDSQTFVLWKGKLHPLPEGFVLMIPTKIAPFVFNSLFTVRGKLIMALDLFKPKGDPKNDESLSSFVKRRLGQEALDKIAEPLVAGIHAGTPETMSIKSSYPRFVEMEQMYRSLIIGMLKSRGQSKKDPQPQEAPTMFVTLKNGLIELVSALADKLDNRSVLTKTSINKINKKPDNHYVVDFDNGQSIEADSVILSTPAFVSAKLINDIDPEISEKLTEIPYVSTATISLAYKKTDLTKPLDGFGFVVPRIEDRKIMAATFSSQKYAYRAPEGSVLIRCFIGGSQNEDLVKLGEEELIRIAKEELADILDIKSEPTFTKVFKWNKAMPQYVIGHSEKISWLDERLEHYPGLFLTGSAYKGIGIADSIHNAEITALKSLSSAPKIK